MKNGRILAAAMAEKHPRPTACIGLALSVLLLCNGCVARFHSTSFDVKPKPSSTASATNFRVQAVSDGEHDQKFENALKAELEKLERKQNSSLPAVPYSVGLRYLGHEETSDATKTLTGLLFLCSCFVLPQWDSSTHRWEISTTLLGETASFRGERSDTDVASWFMLPLGIYDILSADGGGAPPLSESMAKAVFDSLTQARYDKAVSAMRLKAKQQLLGGKRLSESEERLLEDDTSLDILVARAKHPATKNSGLSALARIDDPETLADIAIHSSVPEIRQTAAQRTTGLLEARFAELAAESSDLEVADTFLNRISDDALLCQVAENRSALGDIKAVAVEKIRQESVLADIAKSPDGQSEVQELAVGRIAAESVLADIAAHASDAKVRLAAIGKIDNPAILLASVAKDADPGNRLAALNRINHPKALAAIMRKSGDAEVRLRAVRKITDPAVLKEAVAHDADESVRLAALGQSADQDVFRLAAQTDSSPAVRAAAVDKLMDAAAIDEIAQSDANAGVRRAAVAKTGDQSILSRIARNDPASEVRLLAVRRLQATDVLEYVAGRDKSAEVRAAAVSKIDDQAFLATIARQDADAAVRREAILRVTDQAVLAAAARGDADAENRLLAIRNLADESVLREIAVNEKDATMRDAAFKRLPATVQEELLAVRRQSDVEAVAEFARGILELFGASQSDVRQFESGFESLLLSGDVSEADIERLLLGLCGASQKDIRKFETALKLQMALEGASLEDIQKAFPPLPDDDPYDFGDFLRDFGAGMRMGCELMESWKALDE